MPATRHFLGWEQPVVEAATAFLTADWQAHALDLSSCLVVVPTRHAGRRLRAFLAQFAARRGAALLPPQTVTPHYLFEPRNAPIPVLRRVQTLALWTDLLRCADLTDLPNLFPSPPPEQDFQWALNSAAKLCEVRELAGEKGCTFADIAEQLGAAFGDGPRWRELAVLEQRYFDRVRASGCADLNTLRAEAVHHPPLPRRVVVLAVPDPVPLAVSVLEVLAARTHVEICIHAPPELADAFDAWGRPITAAWIERAVDVPLDAIGLLPTPGGQAEAIAEMLDAGVPAPDLAVGVPDPEVVPFLERTFRRRGIAIYDPEGKPVCRHGLFHLLGALADVLMAADYESFARLLRHPDLLQALTHDLGNAFVVDLLRDLDTLQNDALPATFDDILATLERHPEKAPSLREVCERFRQHLMPVAERPFPENVLGFLHMVYRHRELDPGNDSDHEFVEVAATVRGQLDDLTGPAIAVLGLTAAQSLRLLLHALSWARFYPEGEESQLDFEGWLELHWNNAPHLVVTGFNEGFVPETILADPFLPDRARKALGMRHNEQRFARDAYLLSAMLASRRAGGSVRLLLSKNSTAGDALKPSRLLFLCPDEELPERTIRLFGDAPETQQAIPRTLAWRLEPRSAPPPRSLSVTAFRDYLACPFRFYLKRVVGMEALDDRKTEMDAMDFGNFCHRALEAIGQSAEICEATDARAITAFLHAELDRVVAHQYGPNPSVAVRIQMEAARQRLAAAARQQAEFREQGWRIVQTEVVPGGNSGVMLNGMRVRGMIDRIDRHPDGRILLLDYKTSDQPGEPEKAHLSTTRNPDDAPAFTRFERNGKTYRWTDLQLPLYCLMVQEELGGEPLCGYFNLPKAVTETGVSIWNITPDLLEAARNCAEAIIEAIRSGVFWPPTERLTYDDFERILFGSVAEAVNPAGLLRATRGQEPVIEGLTPRSRDGMENNGT